MTDRIILWSRLDTLGHEWARLQPEGARWQLEGTAVFTHNGRPCRLDYTVLCDLGWRTLGASVRGWVGAEALEVEIEADEARRWRLNGAPCREVTGCIDVDLNFSPSTNLLPIRRLGLAVGQAATVRAAWLRFPGFTLEPLEQVYRRVGETAYRYESAGGRFVADLEVDAAGFVLRYPGGWVAETTD